MATSTTLSAAAEHYNNPIVAGVAESVITVSPFYEFVPYLPIAGNSIKINRESTLGAADFADVDATLGGASAYNGGLTTADTTFSLTTCIGQAEVDRFIAVTSAAAGIDQMAVEVSSKAKNIGRKWFEALVVDGASSPDPIGLPDQGVQETSAGAALSFALLDDLLHSVVAKNGEVDWIMMNAGQLSAYKALVRATGGAFEYSTSPVTNRNVLSYEGVPIFRNDYITDVESTNTATTGGSDTSVYAGCWDDGSMKVGLAMLYPQGTPAGIDVRALGESHTQNADITRVIQYGQWALCNAKGAGRLHSVTP